MSLRHSEVDLCPQISLFLNPTESLCQIFLKKFPQSVAEVLR